ncbi:probable metabolite transport protein CsbC [Hylaeus volcanicus]|uniref:probable metabolite transport protein CsbC n=1 Tax=Hylaeus volcanicus TaxID=313075 RepID=UPI0023B8686F|nr:probable metabolite transport protein CsbC [Hylaeus volcanicus]XP_053990294.1 probable metabolite transport protein CsbC [Hylaeus volcanicus]XP_053990295.1 probable metabolite transport protein CsbC [Hylaeus volcanicus]XP_053990296.1 probable metabolite transport protein CsbC [Hylaeus volcanicus]XP_053990297.1 probable metabolite transport protein CsbC [Hylaeus volcanicus]
MSLYYSKWNESHDDNDEFHKPISFITKCTSYIKSIEVFRLLACIGCSTAFLMGYNLSVLNTILPIITGDLGWCDNDSINPITPFSFFLVALPKLSNHHMQYTPSSIVKVTLECHEATPKQSLLQSSVMLGAAFGSMFTGSLMNRFGRRRSIILINLGFIGTAFLSAFSTNLLHLLSSRVLTGVLTGIATIAPSVYVSEMAPSALQNFYSLIPAVAVNVGILAGIIVGLPIILPHSTTPYSTLSLGDWNFNRLWWRLMMIFPIPLAFSMIYLLSKWFPYETPIFLRLQGNISDAEQVEEKIWSRYQLVPMQQPAPQQQELKEEKQEEQMATHIELEKMNCDGLQKNKYNCEMDSYKFVTTEENQSFKIPILLALLKNSNVRQQLIIGWILSIFQQLTGINVFISASNTLFLKAGLSYSNTTLASAFMAFLAAMCLTLATFQFNHFSRRKVFVLGNLCMFFVLLPSASSEYVLEPDSVLVGVTSVFSIFAFISIFSFSYGPGLFVYLSELWPSNIREEALSIAFSLNWASCFIVVIIASQLSLVKCTRVFSFLCLLGAFFSYIFVTETKINVIEKAVQGPFESYHYHDKFVKKDTELGNIT